MKNKTSSFSNKNSLKLFLGVFVSVVSVFALAYFVQNPLFQKQSEAASYSYTLYITPSVKTANCNPKIESYKFFSQFVNAYNYSTVLTTKTTAFPKKNPSQFSQKVTGVPLKYTVVAKSTVSAYDKNGTKIGRALSLGTSRSILANGTVAWTVAIPCSGY